MNFQVARVYAIAEARGACANPWCRVPGEDVHHIIHRQEGGSDDVSNLILLCQNCHALYHLGLVGRRTIKAWKVAAASGETEVFGVYLSNWPALPSTLKRRLRYALRCGSLDGLIGVCSGVFWNTDEPELIVTYGFPLANAFRQRGRYQECSQVATRLAVAIDTIGISRGELLGFGLKVRLSILYGRIQRGIGQFSRALSHFDKAIMIAEYDQYAGWYEDTFLAKVDRMSIRTRLNGTTSEDLDEIGSLRRELASAQARQLIRSPVRVAAFFGDLAVAEARAGVQAADSSSVLQSMRPAIETLRALRYTRGYSLRLLNLADMLRTMIPVNGSRRATTLDEIRNCYELAAHAATRRGRIALEHSVIGAGAQHIRATLNMLNEGKYRDLAMEKFQ